jgi:hypothetical protein
MRSALQNEVENHIRRVWQANDPHVRIVCRPRGNAGAPGMLDVTVVSALFAGQDSEARERLFAPVFADVPRDIQMRMTYCLLLTPDEAAHYFPDDAPTETTVPNTQEGT